MGRAIFCGCAKGELMGTWSLGCDMQLPGGGFLWAGVSPTEQDSEQHLSSPKPPTAFAFPQGPAGMEGSAGPKGDTVRASCWLALTLVGMKPGLEGFPWRDPRGGVRCPCPGFRGGEGGRPGKGRLEVPGSPGEGTRWGRALSAHHGTG